MDAFVAGRRELSIRGLIPNDDRGYGTLNLLQRFIMRNIGGVMVMPNNRLRCHPFAAEPGFDFSCDNNNNELNYDIKEEIPMTMLMLMKEMTKFQWTTTGKRHLVLLLMKQQTVISDISMSLLGEGNLL